MIRILLKKHWSNRDHPLELPRFTVSVNENDNDGDRRVLICDGCLQPITTSHPCYYACIQCGFFLHSFCATKLPFKLPAGASPFHPQHSLSLKPTFKFYNLKTCGICGYSTNGFFYECETCDITIDIRCAFLPKRIRHKSHKHHPLVQRRISGGMEYACITCSTFQTNITWAFYPSKLKHRYGDHSIILRYPPFFYEGVIYCQICEERVNNRRLLYHCEECDQPFHHDCLHWFGQVKLRGTLKVVIDKLNPVV